MVFWRNPEIKKQLLGYMLGSAAGLLLVWLFAMRIAPDSSWQLRWEIGLLALGAAGAALLAGGLFHFISTAARYRRISHLAELLDVFLHGDQALVFSGQAEGELAILQDEIWKMTVMLREQADALKGEKQYLCDAVTDMSHQLRTPLTSLNLIQAMLSEPELTPSRRDELLRQQRILLRRIDELLATLLKMARIDAGAVRFACTRVDLSGLVKEAAAPLLIPMELKEQRLLLHGGEEAGYTGDLAWSVEAVGNILKNCMEHTPSGGQIDVYWEENAVYSELRVEDNGPGITPEDLPHILERFYKGKNQDGFGVGLAFARMVFTAQNGVLTAENRVQGGARFTVRFYKGTI